MVAGFARTDRQFAEMARSQAKNLYVMVATIVAASISIWIALLAGPGS